jgi:hypothetical protein
VSDGDDLDPAAAAYDRELVPWLFEHWVEPMADYIAPERSSRIVDVACGSGLIICHLLRRLVASGRVRGVDIDATGRLSMPSTCNLAHAINPRRRHCETGALRT